MNNISLTENLIEKKAFAKVNLYLKILSKRADNYHEMFTIMHMIDTIDMPDMFDIVRVNIIVGKYISPVQINISCTDKSIPTDERNTAYKAASLYFKYASDLIDIAECEINAINIEIDKRIPSQAGLGGGSSDAAAVLLALNEFFENLLQENILIEIAEQIGADVAFFVKMRDVEGAIAICEGKGEIITPLDTKINLREFKIDIIKPDCGVSTREAFEIFDRLRLDSISGFDRNHIINIFQNGDIHEIAEIMHNDFEDVVMQLNENEKDIETAKSELTARGAIVAQLSGSGSAVFGIFEKNRIYL